MAKVNHEPIVLDVNHMMSDVVGFQYGIDADHVDGMAQAAAAAQHNVALNRGTGWLGWTELPYNQKEIVEKIETVAARVRNEFDAFVVLGIGGSALGPIAIQQALNHLHYNELPAEKRGGPRLYVEDNIDPERMAALMDVIDVKRTCFNVITKSGATAETMSQYLIVTEALKAACRFAATENGVTRFRGVIDEWSAVCGAEGTVLTVEGRGMAALLLDNEAEAVTYQRAALSEILKDHAAACGVAWEPHGEVYGTGEYAVASGSSRWKAIEGFARRCGLTPYFTREGVLCLRGAAEGRRLVLEEPEGVIEASYRDRRYGVLSEVTAVNRAKKLRQTVRNEAFLARGGSCRRVVYVPSRSVNELRYTGRYQIEKSAEDARELTVTLTGSVDAEPMDRVELSLARLGVRGTFRVSETLHTLSASGETTELTLWEV